MGLGGVLDEEGRLEELLDERVFGHHLAELGAGGQGPVDVALGALRVSEADGPGVVLLVLDRRAEGFEAEVLGLLGELGVELDELGGRSLSAREAKSAR